MPIRATGDLARSFAMNQAYGRTKQRLAILTREVSTGRHADPAQTLRGDTRALSALQHRLSLLDGFGTAVAETAARLQAMQTALASMHDIAAAAGPALIAAGGQGQMLTDATLVDAEGNLQRVLAAINTSQAGGHVFSGATPATRAVRSADSLVDTIATLTAPLSTADDVIAAVDQFFAAGRGGGGYVDTIVSAAPEPAGPVHVAADEIVVSPVTAASGPLREVVKGALLAVMAARDVPALAPAERSRLTTAAGTALLGAATGLTGLRAAQGALEARVEHARLRNDHEKSAVEMSYAGLVAADPYRTAAALSEAQSGLETLYAITARLSRMSLAERL